MCRSPHRSRRSGAGRQALWSESTAVCAQRWSPLTASTTGHRASATGTVRGTLASSGQSAGVFLANRARAKAGLNRGMLASCRRLCGRRLEQEASASGVTVILADPRFSSQQCRMCGHIASANRESQAVFRCVNCGHADHADVNAAHNILARGLLLTTGEAVPARARGQAGVRPHKTGKPAAGTTRSAA